MAASSKEEIAAESTAPGATLWFIPHPSSRLFRYLILFLICMVTMGSYFSYDTPGAAVAQLLSKDPSNPMRLSAFQYNMLYSLYAWPNVIIVFLGGYFVDYAGPRAAGVILMALVMIGQSVMTLGAFLSSLALVVLGRLIFASGAELLIVCQGAMIFKWFNGKEMAMAFGFSLTSARVGTIACFAFLPALAQQRGVAAAFGCGALMCAVSATTLAAYLALDGYADSVMGVQKDDEGQIEDASITSGISSLSPSFWLCVGTLTSQYGLIQSFLAVALDFMRNNLGLRPRVGGYEISLVYNVSLVMAPIVGSMLDKYGLRGLITLVGTVVSLFLFMAMRLICPDGSIPGSPLLVATEGAFALGISFALLSSTVWPTIPVVVSPKQIGMAIGIAQALQNLGVGTVTLSVGLIYDHYGSYTHVLNFLIGIAVFSAILAFVWNVEDLLGDGRVNGSGEASSEDRVLLESGRVRVTVYEVSPMSVLIVRRQFYESIEGEGEVGMKRRDYYRSLGISDLEPSTPEYRPSDEYVPPLLLRKKQTAIVDVPDAVEYVEPQPPTPRVAGGSTQRVPSLSQLSSGSCSGTSTPLAQSTPPVNNSADLREALRGKKSRRRLGQSLHSC